MRNFTPRRSDHLTDSDDQFVSGIHTGLIQHSDRGTQYVSIKYTERLAEAGIEPSIGSIRDGYDNALAETVIGLF